MLSLQMKSGEYLTIGENIVVQVFQDSGSYVRVSVKAPREIPVLRGKVRELSGKQRPEGLLDCPPKKNPSTQYHDARQLEKLAQRTDARRRASQEWSDAVKQMQSILCDLKEQPGLNALRAQVRRLENSELLSDQEAL